jgi:hypothetical protein
MIIFMRTCFLVMAVMLAATLPAHADSDKHEDRLERLEKRRIVTPEMEPALGLGALVFISGAIMVIRGRRKE